MESQTPISLNSSVPSPLSEVNDHFVLGSEIFFNDESEAPESNRVLYTPN